ncbi:MAG: hypothetical protein HKN23_16670 [Verrucomicrobiales bacterium]|nr:hypothetical protein [Verrucomicrobiales bacterium]
MNSKRLLFLLLSFWLVVSGPQFVSRADEAVLRPGDKIRLQIKGVPDEEKTELNGDYTISEDGTIPLPYISNPRAAGLKPSVLARAIESAYQNAQIYTSPTIVINFGDERVVRQVTVTGGVRKNGPVEYRDGLTLLQAISTAGGPSEFGKLKEVKVIRGGKATKYNVEDIVRNPQLDPVLKPDDSIIVPEAGRKL